MCPDLSEIRVEGNDAEVDSFVACIRAAIIYWGRDYEYDYIAGLSGSAFSPVRHEDESCAAWWTEFGNDSRMEFLGKALGFTAKKSPAMSVRDFEKKGELSEELADFWKRVKEAVLEGKVVMIGAWPLWSIITRWDDDIEKMEINSVSVGCDICRPSNLDTIYILTPCAASITRMEAIAEAIRFGADVADGTFRMPGFQYGGRLYDAILKRLERDIFCEDCGERSCNCAWRTMVRIHGTAGSAVRFLRFAGEFMGKRLPRQALDVVIGGYDTIAQTSGMYTDRTTICENWDHPEFKTKITSSVQAMKVAHKDASVIFRRLAQGL